MSEPITGRVLTPEEQARKAHEECEMHAGPLYHDWTHHLPKSGRTPSRSTSGQEANRMTKPGYVYVASSWRCLMQEAVCATLKAAGIPHYDFKNPDEAEGFRWTDVGLPADGGCTVEEYMSGLQHPRAVEGFGHDMAAMEKADTFVLVLPCNRSAHLELGWAVGQGKRTAVLLTETPVVPELMYKMVDYLAPSVFDLLGWLGVED